MPMAISGVFIDGEEACEEGCHHGRRIRALGASHGVTDQSSADVTEHHRVRLGALWSDATRHAGWRDAMRGVGLPECPTEAGRKENVPWHSIHSKPWISSNVTTRPITLAQSSGVTSGP